MRDFDKLHDLAEQVDRKMGYYACFLGEDEIRKVLLVVRLVHIPFLCALYNGCVDLHRKEAAGHVVWRCAGVHRGHEADPRVPAHSNCGGDARSGQVDPDQGI